jgi:glyoxylase-like metal-dependent hydrolase (beta-lactamase superfamily II)
LFLFGLRRLKILSAEPRKITGHNKIIKEDRKRDSKYFDTYSFYLGDFRVISILDGILHADYASILNGVPPQKLENILHSHNLQPTSTIDIPWTVLFIDTGKNKILIDTGMSKTFVDFDTMSQDAVGPPIPSRKPERSYISAHPVDCGHLLENLRYEDIKATEIDTIIITHAHADHIGGLVDPRSDTLAFPNARIFMWKEEWQFIMGNPGVLANLNKYDRGPVPEIIQLEYARQNLAPIKDHLTLVDSEQTNIVPGIRYLNAHGHSYMMCVEVTSANENLLCFADAAILPIQLEQPEWLYTNDLYKEQAANTRMKLCEWAIMNNALIASPHFPFPGLGHIGRGERGYKWLPISVDDNP